MTSSDTCYFCDSGVDVEEHHIVPQRFSGSDLPTNTVDLCHECHWKLERLYNRDFWEAIGVNDPRSTKESHVTCYYHSCLELSVGHYHNNSGRLVYRCAKHMPDEEGESLRENNDEPELRCLQDDWSLSTEGDSIGLLRDLKYVLRNIIGNEPASPDTIRDVIGGDRISELNFPDDSGRDVTEVQILTQTQVYHAEYLGDSWDVRHERSR